MKYTKHQIKRIRDVNEKYFEVVIGREGLNFSPGCCVKLYNEDVLIPIASGIGEPWVRLILNRDLFESKFPAGTNSVRLSLEIVNIAPHLMAEEKPSFVLTPEMVGIFFSYVSTYPQVKCKVCYLGEAKVQEDWISASHKLVSPKQIKKLDNLYVLGRQELIERKVRNVVNTCKSSYLI
jgi:hypothetical protein